MTKLPRLAKNVAKGCGRFGLKTSLRIAFGAVSAVGAAVYHGLDPVHLTLQHGWASAISGFGAIFTMNAATIALVSTIGAFSMSQMTLAGIRAYREGGNLSYLFKKSCNSAIGAVSGVGGFLVGGVASMALAAKFSGASMFEQPSLEDRSLVATLWNNTFGSGADGGNMSAHGPYDFDEISDAFDHFEWSEMDGGDVILGVGETFSQIQGTVLTGLEEAFKQSDLNSVLASADFLAATGVAVASIGAAIFAFKMTCKGLDYCTGAKLHKHLRNCDEATVEEVHTPSVPKPKI